jgi:uncharacterized membrane protein YdbT with pleckstrin-like domain
MGYIEQNLVAGETVVYRAKLHWVIFLWPVVFLLIALFSFMSRNGAGGFFLIVGLIWGLSSYINSTSSEFGVTNRRVLIKVGFIRRRSLELFLSKLEGIGVNQSIPGRIFGYGTIMVTGTGGTKEFFNNIAAPLQFRKMVQQQSG